MLMKSKITGDNKMNTQSLIAITDKKINEELAQTIDARNLHKFLEIGSQFSNWIKRQIEQYDFTEHIDFVTINNSVYSPPRKDCHITLDMAKQLSMVERNPKGKEARRYFIQCEKELRQQTQSIDIEDQLLLAVQALVAHKNELKLLRQDQNKIKEQLDENTDRLDNMEGNNGYITVRGFDRINDVNLTYKESNKLGRICSKMCRRRGIKIQQVYDKLFGSVEEYPIEVLEQCLDNMLEDN